MSVHCHIALTSKIILAMLVNTHSFLEGRVSQDMEGGVDFLKAEGITVSTSLQVKGHRTSLVGSRKNEHVSFRNSVLSWSKH